MEHLKIPTCIHCHDDASYLATVINSVKGYGPCYVFTSRLAWNGSSGGAWNQVVEVAERAGAEVVLGSWPHESLHRSASIEHLKKLGYKYCFIPDSDEVAEPKLLENLAKIAHAGIASRVFVSMDTYWKSVENVVRPRETLKALIMINLEEVHHVSIRHYEGGLPLTLEPEAGLIHHLSYAGSNQRIMRKITSWGHRNQVLPDWYQRVWLGFDSNPMMRDVHPTHPQAYKQIEKIKVPEILSTIPVEQKEDIEPPFPWPTVSIVFPLHGGEEDIRLCLSSVADLKGLIHETIVVDDASPDRAATVAESFEGVRVIRSAENLGFAAACNIGYRESSGEVIFFLNSDTIVPKSGFIRLIESLMSSGSVAAAGPYSNNTGHHQRIPSTYTALETMPLFADTIARMDVDDLETDMLVGFAIAIKRSVLVEIGGFDERFKIGTFEDNDICYRMRRNGYKLLRSRRSFVHHAGSRSLARRKEHPAVLLTRNQQIFMDKWAADLESGFASTLSGLGSAPIVFDAMRKPENREKHLRRLAKKANISLTMIVRDEERVIRQCLESVCKYFTQIVIVDTGSTDRTMEICREFGVELYEAPWEDSFSASRNISLQKCTGDWCMWIDADDTVPLSSIEKILYAAIDAPPDLVGYVVPVRFVDGGPTGGTQVDHVKLFRNLKTNPARFQFRIHEQVLPSLRATGKSIGRVDAVVLHSGYDNSIAGQKKKRIRDEKLLKLDLEENPQHPFPCFNMGMTEHFCTRHAEAIQWLQKSIDMAEAGESHVRKAYALMGVSKRELGDLEGALDTFAQGLAAVVEDPELEFQTAVVLTSLGRFEDARQRYLRINPDVSDHFSSVDRGILGFKRLHNLGTVCRELGRYPEARDWWRQAIQAAPTFTPSAIDMFEAALACSDVRTAAEALDAVRNAEGPTERWAQMACRFAQETGQDPEHMLRAFLQSHPCAMGPLMSLAKMLLARGDEYGATPILEELDRLGSDEAAFFRGISAIRHGDFETALDHMIRALELNPSSEQTNEQIASLVLTLGEDAPPRIEEAGNDVLAGPHVGKLGPARSKAGSKKKIKDGSASTHSVVVVTYNSVTTIQECVKKALDTMGESDELIVVDNASTDGTVYLLDELKGSDPRVTVILNEANIGYSKAVNIGWLASGGERLTALNPDAFVPGGWLQALEARLVEEVAAVGPMSDNVSGDQFVGHLLDGRHPDVGELPQILASERTGETIDTKFLVGICLMARRETLDKHGLLDETTELGADDLEFSWRMKNLGYRLAIAADVFIRHAQGVSFSSLARQEASARVRRSDAALARKLEAFYGAGQIPTSREIWGTDIFEEALARWISRAKLRHPSAE